MAAAALAEDLRRYKRIKPGRRARLSVGSDWRDCEILDISGGGASIAVDSQGIDEPQVVLCDPELGLIAATVERRAPDGIVVAFGIDETAKERLIDRLMALLNAELL